LRMPTPDGREGARQRRHHADLHDLVGAVSVGSLLRLGLVAAAGGEDDGGGEDGDSEAAGTPMTPNHRGPPFVGDE